MGTVRPMEEHRRQVVGIGEVEMAEEEMGMVVVEMVEVEMGMVVVAKVEVGMGRQLEVESRPATVE